LNTQLQANRYQYEQWQVQYERTMDELRREMQTMSVQCEQRERNQQQINDSLQDKLIQYRRQCHTKVGLCSWMSIV
jgi:hypothetical protein